MQPRAETEDGTDTETESDGCSIDMNDLDHGAIEDGDDGVRVEACIRDRRKPKKPQGELSVPPAVKDRLTETSWMVNPENSWGFGFLRVLHPGVLEAAQAEEQEELAAIATLEVTGAKKNAEEDIEMAD